MTFRDFGELVDRLRYPTDDVMTLAKRCVDAADTIEQLACERAMVEEELNRQMLMLVSRVEKLCKSNRLMARELQRHCIPLPGEPDTRGTGYAGEVGCG